VAKPDSTPSSPIVATIAVSAANTAASSTQ
jgi:hypothetical protein